MVIVVIRVATAMLVGKSPEKWVAATVVNGLVLIEATIAKSRLTNMTIISPALEGFTG